MKIYLLGALCLLSACQGDAGPRNREAGAPAAAAGDGGFRNDDERALYALGVIMGERLGEFNLTAAELEFVKRGLTDRVTNATIQVDMPTVGPKVQALARTRSSARSDAEKEKGRVFAERAAQEAGAVKLPSGLVYRETQPGTGATPGPEDRVRVHYRGTLVDGTEFDSSIRRGEPAEFGVGGVIRCWTEALQRMKVGGKARIVCPADIAYGDRGQRQIPPGSTLVFEVELIEILPRPAAATGDASALPIALPGGDGGARPTIVRVPPPTGAGGHP